MKDILLLEAVLLEDSLAILLGRLSNNVSVVCARERDLSQTTLGDKEACQGTSDTLYQHTSRLTPTVPPGVGRRCGDLSRVLLRTAVLSYVTQILQLNEMMQLVLHASFCSVSRGKAF